MQEANNELMLSGQQHEAELRELRPMALELAALKLKHQASEEKAAAEEKKREEAEARIQVGHHNATLCTSVGV